MATAPPRTQGGSRGSAGRRRARREAGLPVSPARAELFPLFEAEVERSFLRTRTVADYARRLGYSERPLARAGRIAVRLGFSEPTNFAKFFRKGTGLTPGTFRKREPTGA